MFELSIADRGVRKYGTQDLVTSARNVDVYGV